MSSSEAVPVGPALVHPGMSDANLSSSFRILDLSAEVVESITSYLDDESILSVRQVCRALRTHSVFEFGKRFLSRVVVILHPLSLGMLLEIAQDLDLSRSVKCVTISGERIGGDLNLDTPMDKDKVLDLQKRMDESSEDRQMLSEIFRGLVNLEKIELNNSSYADPGDRLRCGREHLIAKGWVRSALERDDTVENNVIRVWNTVAATIENSPNRDRIEWILELDSSEEDVEQAEMFDPNSAPWTPDYGKRVAKICFYRGLPGGWGLDLLRSMANLEVFQIRGNFKPFAFSHPATGMFVWPRVYTLWLNAIKVDQDSMMTFLGAHRDTILTMALYSVDVNQGSWLDIFECIAELPSLERLDISSLRQLEVLPEHSDPWGVDIPSKHCNTRIECENRWLIQTALRAFTTRFRCYQCSHDTVLSHVDLSLAAAAVADEVFYKKGEWVLRRRVIEARALERAS